MSPVRTTPSPVLPEYRYTPGTGWDHAYLWPTVARAITARRPRRIFELGCGNGSIARRLAEMGHSVTAVDASESGIEQARAGGGSASFEVACAYDDLAGRFGTFDLVLSLEVIEHLISPKCFIENVHRLLEPGGTLIPSTPYHGYLKNLAIALAGRFDAHVNPLWEGGLIKFFSIRTIRRLLESAGFRIERTDRVGRIPPLAKSMVVIARRYDEGVITANAPRGARA